MLSRSSAPATPSAAKPSALRAVPVVPDRSSVTVTQSAPQLRTVRVVNWYIVPSSSGKSYVHGRCYGHTRYEDGDWLPDIVVKIHTRGSRLVY